jgi:hypothetical protein
MAAKTSRTIQGYLVLDRRGELRLLKSPPRRDLPGTLSVQVLLRIPEQFFDPPERAQPLPALAPVKVNVLPLPPLRIVRAE